MTDIEQKALIKRLRLRRSNSHMLLTDPPFPAPDRDCHAAADLLEQLLPIAQEFDGFRQEVSDVVGDYFHPLDFPSVFQHFIIPKPKPDPLADVLKDFGGFMPDADDFRAALDARGLEIRKKNDD